MMETILILLITVAFPIAALTFWIFGNKWFELRRLEAEANASSVAKNSDLDSARTNRLEQRVSTLERILTDRSSSLAEEIEQLRDKPLN